MAPILYVTGTCFVFLTLRIVNEMAQLFDGTLLVKPASPGCDQRGLQTVEMVLLRLTALEQDRKPERFEANCRESQQLLGLMEKFASKCYAPDIQKLAHIFIHSSQATVEKICTRQAVPKSSLGYLPNSPPLHSFTCLRNFINQSATLAPEERTQFACCQSAKVISCAEDYLSRTPCTRRRSPIMLDFVRSLLANLNRLGCSSNELESPSDGGTYRNCGRFSASQPLPPSSSSSPPLSSPLSSSAAAAATSALPQSPVAGGSSKRFSSEMVVMIDFHNLINI